MSGEGARFKRAGYLEIKPLIKVDGKPFIEHVVNLFPREDNFIFICREEHLQTTVLRKILLDLKPKAKIVSTVGDKFGPVYATMKAFDFIDDNEPAIVNYCDFSMDWDYSDFKKVVKKNGYDACLPVYTGFHPHLLHEKNFYASIKVDAEGFLEEIREKFSYTVDKTQSMHSPGTHYFKHGKYVKKFFQQMIDEKIDLNGEYYVSLVFNLLVRDGFKVGFYDKIKHFCQWGTPEDLEEYIYWSRLFNLKLNRDKNATSVPLLREQYIKTPFSSLLDNYNKSYKYWEEYFN